MGHLHIDLLKVVPVDRLLRHLSFLKCYSVNNLHLSLAVQIPVLNAIVAQTIYSEFKLTAYIGIYIYILL